MKATHDFLKKTSLILLMLICAQVLQAQDNDDWVKEVLGTWKKHCEMNELLLKAIDETHLTDQSSSGGRTVGEQFAHMHEVRIMWMEEWVNDLNKSSTDREIDAEESKKHDHLSHTLKASDDFVSTFIRQSIESKTKIGEMSPIRFMGYLIAHEAHTRGQIILALKQSGHPLPPQVTYGIWQW